MRIQYDTLKSATILKKKGFKASDADSLMSTISEIEIFNLHSKQEVDSMLSQSVREVFAEQERKRIEQRREFNARMKDLSKYHESQLKEQRAELLASRRWMIGTIITVGLSLAAYLSALVHFKH